MAISPDAATDQATSAAPPAANTTSDTAPMAPPDPAASGVPAAPPMPTANPQVTPPPPPKMTFAEGAQRTLNPQYTTDASGTVQRGEAARASSGKGLLAHILFGALEGAARGVAAPTPEGGRGKGAAFSAGADAARKGALQADTRARAIAQQNFENQQAATEQKVRVNHELAQTAAIAQNMKFEAEDHPGIQKTRELENQGLEIAHRGAMERLNKDAYDFGEEMAKNGAPPTLFTEHGPELNAQIPGAVAGNTIAATNGIQGKGSGINTWHTQDLTVPFTGQPVTINKYDKGVDRDGVPIPNPTVFTPDGKTTLMDLKKAYFQGRSQLYQMLQQHATLMTNEDQKAKLAESAAKTKEEGAEAFKAAEEGTLTKKQSDLMGNTSGAGAGAPGTNGDAFLNTLEPGFRGVVEGIGTGRLTYSDRQLFDYKTGLPTATMQAVLRAYPDFQVQNAKTWQKTKDEYMGHGSTAKKVVAYNTAMEHAAAAYDKTNLNALNNPWSGEGKARVNDINFVSQEIGNAISTGVLAQKEGDEIKSGLTSRYPHLARAALKEAIKLLNDKTGEFQTKFNAAAPSKAVQVPQLMSAKAKSAYDHVQSDGHVPYNENATGQVAAPTTQTQPAPVSEDGITFYPVHQ